jgi:hypothetical protein
VANVRAFQAIGEALRVYLSSTYPSDLRAEFPCSFQVLSTGQLAQFDDPSDASVACTLFLYRITLCDQLRNSYQPGRTPPAQPPALPLELHWMLSVWANGAAAEQIVFAWAMRQLNQQPLLDSTMLVDADYAPSDVVHIVPEELPIEDLMRIWDAIEPSYRLSATYVTRVVRLDVDHDRPLPAVTTRMSLRALATTEPV